MTFKNPVEPPKKTSGEFTPLFPKLGSEKSEKNFGHSDLRFEVGTHKGFGHFDLKFSPRKGERGLS